MTARRKEPSAEKCLKWLRDSAYAGHRVSSVEVPATDYWTRIIRRALRQRRKVRCTCEDDYAKRNLVEPRCGLDDPDGHRRDQYYDRLGKKRKAE